MHKKYCVVNFVMKGHKQLVKDPCVDDKFNSKYCWTNVFFEVVFGQTNYCQEQVSSDK